MLTVSITDSYPCMEHQFKCHKENKCISKTLQCNGNSDCMDGEDENECRMWIMFNLNINCIWRKMNKNKYLIILCTVIRSSLVKISLFFMLGHGHMLYNGVFLVFHQPIPPAMLTSSPAPMDAVSRTCGSVTMTMTVVTARMSPRTAPAWTARVTTPNATSPAAASPTPGSVMATLTVASRTTPTRNTKNAVCCS